MRNYIFILFLAVGAVCFGQGKDGHLTYSGRFSLDGPRSNPSGRATYSYLLAEDGSRIFDGHFKYTNSDPVFTYEGDFKDNKQVGEWKRVFNNSEKGPKAWLRTVTILNFNERGLLDGRFTERDYYRNGKVITNFDATYRNGILNGAFMSKYNGDEEIRGQYENDSPVGMWKYSWLPGPVNFDEIDDHGHVRVKHVEESTGDISYSWERLPTYPGAKTYPEYNYDGFRWWESHRLLRDSDVKIYKVDLTKKYDTGGDLMRFPRHESSGKGGVYLRHTGTSWEDFVYWNTELKPEDIGDESKAVRVLIMVGKDYKIDVLERDTSVSEKLNDETIRLLRKLDWKNFDRGDAGLWSIRVKYEPEYMMREKRLEESK